MTQDQALSAAHAQFPGKSVASVTRYTLGEWRDGGWKGWRVTLGDGTLHWLSQRGKHQDRECCPKQRPNQVLSKSVQRRLAIMAKPEVVTR